MSKVEESEVFEAARRLAESGERPSAPKIRKLLGDRGGMATIQKHLESWRASEQAQEIETQKIAVMPELLVNDANTLIQQIWSQSTALADKDIQAEKEKLSIDRKEMQSSLDDTLAVSEAQEMQIESLKQQLETLNDEKNEATKELEAERHQKGVLEERLSNHQSMLAGTKQELDGALKDLKEARKIADEKTKELTETKITLNAQLAKQESELKQKINVIEDTTEKLNNLTQKTKEKDTLLANQASDLSVLKERSTQLESHLSELKEREKAAANECKLTIQKAEDRENKLLKQIEELTKKIEKPSK